MRECLLSDFNRDEGRFSVSPDLPLLGQYRDEPMSQNEQIPGNRKDPSGQSKTLDRHSLRRVFVPGGAGYVGSKLVPALLRKGYEVVVYDLYLYGDEIFAPHPCLTEVKGDIREVLTSVADALKG